MIEQVQKTFDVSLNGGVLIVGSLYWDDIKIRADWRASYLSDKAIVVPAPIRYGRISNKRNCTFTMVFSTECNENEKLGTGIFLPFIKTPVNIQIINEQAYWLMKAERERRNVDNIRFFWDWGTLGICVNPELLIEGTIKNEQTKFLLQEWSKKFTGFVPDNYRVGKDNPIIDENGILNVGWSEALGEYDFFIATATISGLKEYPSEINIADRMLINGYDEYFKRNMLHSITTFQDEKIKALLEEGKNKYPRI